MSNKIKFSRGDVGDFYEPSDSEGEYTEHEKKLLKKVRTSKQRNTEPVEQVLAFDDHDDNDDDEDDYDAADDDDADVLVQNSDFDDDDDVTGGDDGIPDERAWGKKRKDFYSTDFVDQDYSSYNVDEEQAAEQEEQEARAIQQRLAKQLNEADFTLDVFGTAAAVTHTSKAAVAAASSANNKIQTDLSDLNHRERLQLFRKDSPEFEGLVQDFEQRLQESATVLEPVLTYFRERQSGVDALPPAVEFVQTKNNLILTYCSNVAFYLVLKAKRAQIRNHPLVKRLVQMRQLLVQLEDRYDKVIRPQLEVLLERIADGKELVFQNVAETNAKIVKTMLKKASKLKFLKDMEKISSNNATGDSDEEMEDDDDDDEKTPQTAAQKSTVPQSDSEDDEQEEEAEDMGADDERRQITYQMSKNKGLTPHRKKELRNPRVKHRNKFRKAIIRRKGAVRTVRKETKRYDGEVSGIKASTKKGIKIK